MTTLIIGNGEIGRALGQILKQYNPAFLDRNQEIPSEFQIIHICFPYTHNFISEVNQYKELYKAEYVIIHSTVPVGTSRQCNAIHSPIRGMHPDLEPGIRTFVKFLGGKQASEVAEYFKRAGLKVMLFDNPETTEAAKLFDTEYYRTCIEFCHRVKQYCDEHDLNFSDVYRIPNMTYNIGYTELGHQEFTRPILEPIMKSIGGHCVMQNKGLIELSENEKKE